MPFWIPIVVTLVCRVLIGLCAVGITKRGEDDSKLLSDAHGVELFVIYVLIINFLSVPLVQKLLVVYMALASAWGLIQLICSPALIREGHSAATYWILARFISLVGMVVPLYWGYTTVF